MEGTRNAAAKGRLDSIRNIGILAHVDAGKTSITEKILYLNGLLARAGEVDEGTTATDYLSVEKRHGITIKSAAVHFAWKDCLFHLIDTPGHVDFGIEVERVLRILDGAVIALCAVSGVQSRTEILAQSCARRQLPRLYFVNKMDRKGADFFGVVEELTSGLEPRAVAVQCPVFAEGKLAGVVDLPSMSFRSFDPGQMPDGTPLDSLERGTREKAESMREALILALSEIDPGILEMYAGNLVPDVTAVRRALGAGARRGQIFPVICGSAFIDESVAILLDEVIACLPSPSDAAVPKGIDPRTGGETSVPPSVDGPLSAFVFKTAVDPSGETLSWARIWSGRIREKSRVYEARSGKERPVRRIYGIYADRLEECPGAAAGSIVALAAEGLPPGASVCDRNFPVVFESLEAPRPVVSQALEPMTQQDLPGIRSALATLATEDASLIVSEDRETGRFEISGQGELHLDIVVERMKREFKLKVRVGNPRVNYRERLKKSVRWKEEFDRDFGGARMRVTVELLVEPARSAEGQPGGEWEIARADGLRVPPAYDAAARRGVGASVESGPSENWPLEPGKVTLLSLSPPPLSAGKTGEIAVEAACAFALRRALESAGSSVLEPVMQADIECPEEFFGAVLGAVTAREGRIVAVEDGVSVKLVSALVPMRKLFGFASELRSTSKGKALFQARFSRYEERGKAG